MELKFKKGDRIVAKDDPTNKYTITSTKNNYIGEVVELCNNNEMRIRTLQASDGRRGVVWKVKRSYFELESNQKEQNYEIY